MQTKTNHLSPLFILGVTVAVLIVVIAVVNPGGAGIVLVFALLLFGVPITVAYEIGKRRRRP